MMALYTRFCVLFFGLMLLLSCFLLYECRMLDGYNFPVYSAKYCPRNETEWKKRSSALNCTGDNGYVCLPNENITELLEFCYTWSFILIQEGICLYLSKRYSALDSYSCNHFQYGCPNSSHVSYKLFENPECTSIGHGCFLVEASCKGTNAGVNTTDDYMTFILVGTVLGVLFFICLFCFLFKCYRKGNLINRRRNQDEEKYHSTIPSQHPRLDMAEKACTWTESIHPNLQDLFESFIVQIPDDPSKLSLAKELLKALHLNDIVKEIRSLSIGVVLHKRLSDENNRPGTVYAYEVNVKYKHNQIVIVEKDSEEWSNFQKENQNLIKVIIIKGNLHDISETKKKVNQKYKQDFRLEIVHLQHASEPYDEVSKLSAKQKIASFQQLIESVIESISFKKIASVVKHVLDSAFSEDNILEICLNADTEQHNVAGTDSYSHDPSVYATKLENETIKKVQECLGSAICAELQRHMELEIKRKFPMVSFDLDIDLGPFFETSHSDISSFYTKVEFALASLLNAGKTPSGSVYSSLWTAKVAEKVYNKLQANKRKILAKISADITGKCKVTIDDLKTVSEQLEEFRRRIDAID